MTNYIKTRADELKAGDVVRCTWTYRELYGWDYWDTACGNAFQFTADGPTENEFKFCPYCGGALVISDDEAKALEAPF